MEQERRTQEDNRGWTQEEQWRWAQVEQEKSTQEEQWRWTQEENRGWTQVQQGRLKQEDNRGWTQVEKERCLLLFLHWSVLQSLLSSLQQSLGKKKLCCQYWHKQLKTILSKDN